MWMAVVPFSTCGIQPYGEIPQGDRWRNRLAYAIFSKEKGNNADQFCFGKKWVPVALMDLMSLDTIFADRHAVVRTGGNPNSAAQLVPYQAIPPWQARIQHLQNNWPKGIYRHYPAHGSILSIFAARRILLKMHGYYRTAQ
jgi:hypothetical protein